MKELTHAEARKLFWYNQDTGKVIRRTNMFKFKSGTFVGRKTGCRYLMFSVYCKDYLLHKFIWFYQTGEWPKKGEEVDHINRNKMDNRWCNLRLTTKLGNSLNRGITANNISGVPGVSIYKASGKWQARISVNRKNIYLGLFKDFADAVKARYYAEQELNYHIANSNSPAKQYLIKHDLL